MKTASPEEILKRLKSGDYTKPWPPWAKLAAARLINCFLPALTTERILLCFEKKDPLMLFESTEDFYWLLGKMARCRSDLKTAQPEAFEKLSKTKWLKDFRYENGKLHVEHGYGFENLISQQIAEIFELPTEKQAVALGALNRGFSSELSLRPQDAKAVRIYLFLILMWPVVQNFTSIRELYDFVFSSIPKEPCPSDMDPIDFEERQFKWFEKLCHRNLGLSLAKRGRPVKDEKIPQPN